MTRAALYLHIRNWIDTALGVCLYLAVLAVFGFIVGIVFLSGVDLMKEMQHAEQREME